MNTPSEITYTPLSESALFTVLSSSPAPFAIYTTNKFIIELVNAEMLQLWQIDSAAIGLPLHTLFQENTHKALFNRLRTVWNTGIPYCSDLSLHPQEINVSASNCYKVSLKPHKNSSGEVFCILHTVTLINNAGIDPQQKSQRGNLSFDIQKTETNTVKRTSKKTVFNLAGVSAGYKKLLAEKENTKKNEESLRTLVMNAHYGLLILRGEDWIIEVVNSVITDLWGKKVDKVLGLPLLKVLPNLTDQPFPRLMQKVFETGLPYGQEEEVFFRESPLGLVPRYINFYYDPIFDGSGKVTGIVVSAEDTTEMVLNRKLLEKSNEELADSNAHLLATNIELEKSKEQLQQLINGLEESEVRFKNLVEEAPVPICILEGFSLHIESANKMMLQVWEKQADILSSPLKEAFPEVYNQPFVNQLEQVFKTGITYTGIEDKAIFEREGVLKELFFNVIFKPLKNKTGRVISIIVIATDVSLQVKARQDLQNTLSLLKFTVEAAKIGTWSLDLQTQVPTFSDRQKEMYGFFPEDDPGVEDLVMQVVEESRAEAVGVMQRVVTQGGLFDLIYAVKGFHDGTLRWLRVLGSTVLDETGKARSFSGVSIETTVHMQDEMRKNQFINIVSHELKTPLASLKVYIQLLEQRAEQGGDQYLAGTLAKADTKLDKMTSIINGFLNISQLESGKIHLLLTEFEMHELIAEVVLESGMQSVSRNILIKTTAPLRLEADKDKIGQVISNLLSNALKYSPGNSPIEISCYLKQDQVVVEVKDQGIGIKTNDQQQIFHRYFRVDSNENNVISGFGIGLYLCHEILERHHGSLYVESIPEKGSTFYFSLPMKYSVESLTPQSL